MKTEPHEFSYDDLEARGREPWDGVKNPTALMHMRNMQPGDLAMVYHTGTVKAAVGVAEVVTGPYPDPEVGNPNLVVVDVTPRYRLARPVTLAEIKADPLCAAWDLVRISRLSVMPASPEHWQRVHELAGIPAG